MLNESSTLFFNFSLSTLFLFGFGEGNVDNVLSALEVAQSVGAVDTGADKDGMDDEEEKVGEGEGTGAGESDEEGEDEDKGTSGGALENEHDKAREVGAAVADGNGEGSTTTHLTLGDKGGRVDFSDTVVDGVSYMSVLP